MDPSLRLRCLHADPSDLGRRLRETRQGAGLTQAEVARGTVSPAHLSRIENGLRLPAPELLVALAERLGTSIEGLLEPAGLDDQNAETVSWPEHLLTLNATRATANWLRRPRDAQAYRRMVAAVSTWETHHPAT